MEQGAPAAAAGSTRDRAGRARVAGRDRRGGAGAAPRRAFLALCALAAAAATGRVAIRPARAADVDRFVPWKDPRGTPALSLKDLAGRLHAIADYHGQVVLVNFWATWCDPCREEMPSMQRLKERLAGERFAILAVNNGESSTRVREYVERARLDFTVLLDPNGDAPRAWRVRVLPASFVVAPDGAVRYSVVGEIDWASPAAVDTVRRLLR